MRNVIINIIYLPKLEKDGLHVTYDTLHSWVMHLPDGTPILLKQDNVLCNQFPYVDVEYLNTINCGAVNMLQTGREMF